MRSFLPLAIYVAVLAGCTYVEPVFVTNASPEPILVLFDGRELEIGPGEQKKMRGLHYSGAVIQFSGGIRVSFKEALRDIVANYADYDPYICRNFRGSRIDVRLADEDRLELLPCNPADSIHVLRPD